MFLTVYITGVLDYVFNNLNGGDYVHSNTMGTRDVGKRYKKIEAVFNELLFYEYTRFMFEWVLSVKPSKRSGITGADSAGGGGVHV